MFGIFLIFNILAVVLGSQNARIVGGDKAPDGEYPYMASLRNEWGYHACAASILDETTLLTAAQCVAGFTASDIKIHVGTNTLNEKGDKYEVLKTTVHPNYSKPNFKHDIALIKLASPMIFGPKVQPINLPSTDTQEEEVLLIGWGSPSLGSIASRDLKQLKVRTLRNDVCESYGPRWSIDEMQICTFTKENEGACHGDFGGPIVNQNGEQVGISSWMMAPCGGGKPDVFTKVFSYKKWIGENK